MPVSLPFFLFHYSTVTHVLQDANLRCEGQRPEPGLLALRSCMAGTGLLKRWQKQNMAQTRTPDGARPSWKHTARERQASFTNFYILSIKYVKLCTKCNILVWVHVEHEIKSRAHRQTVSQFLFSDSDQATGRQKHSCDLKLRRKFLVETQEGTVPQTTVKPQQLGKNISITCQCTVQCRGRWITSDRRDVFKREGALSSLKSVSGSPRMWVIEQLKHKTQHDCNYTICKCPASLKVKYRMEGNLEIWQLPYRAGYDTHILGILFEPVVHVLTDSK